MLQWITEVCFDSVRTGLFECGGWRGCSDTRYCTRCQNMMAGDCVVSHVQVVDVQSVSE